MTCPTCGDLGEVEVQRARSKARTAMVPCSCRVRALMAEVAELRRLLGTLAAQLPAKTGNNHPPSTTGTTANQADLSDSHCRP